MYVLWNKTQSTSRHSLEWEGQRHRHCFNIVLNGNEFFRSKHKHFLAYQVLVSLILELLFTCSSSRMDPPRTIVILRTVHQHRTPQLYINKRQHLTACNDEEDMSQLEELNPINRDKIHCLLQTRLCRANATRQSGRISRRVPLSSSVAWDLGLSRLTLSCLLTRAFVVVECPIPIHSTSL